MNENAARADWAGVGVRLPRRYCTPRGLRLAVERALARRDLRTRARGLELWAKEHDGAARAAEEVERLIGEFAGDRSLRDPRQVSSA